MSLQPAERGRSARDRLVAEAIEATGLDDFGAPALAGGPRPAARLARVDRAAQRDRRRWSPSDGVVTDLSNRLRIEQWRKDHPAVAEQRDRAADHHRRPAPHRHHDPARPHGAGPGEPGAAQLGDRASGAGAAHRDLRRPTRASPRPRRGSTWSSRSSRASPRSTSSARCSPRRTCASSPATSGRCSTRCSSRCRRTTAGCCTRPTWPRRTAGTAGSSSTCSPSTTAQRWLLKSPAHLWHLPTLLAEYPDAIVIQNHRDPLKVIASISALGASLREMTTDRVDVRHARGQYGDDIVVGLDRALDARRAGVFAPGPGRRRALPGLPHRTRSPRSPVSTTQIGLELTAEAESRMRAFLDEHPGDPDNSAQALHVRGHRPRRGSAARACAASTRSTSGCRPRRSPDRSTQPCQGTSTSVSMS